MPSLTGPERCRRKFLRLFPGGFRDETYLDWERDYKWETHQRWQLALSRNEFQRLLRLGQYQDIAGRAVRVEQRARHSMLFSFEKMALRDGLKTRGAAQAFSRGLFEFLHGPGPLQRRFEAWTEGIAELPRKQTRVLTWPVVSVFGFVAQPDTHMFIKPNTLRAAAEAYGFSLRYASRPSWDTYASVLDFAAVVRADLRDLKPRDMIDVQSFLWVQGSDEYA